MIQTKISATEAGTRADDLFATRIRQQIAEADRRKFLYIDVESGDFEVDANEDEAEERLRARRPSGFFVAMRAGGGPVGQFGYQTVPGR